MWGIRNAVYLHAEIKRAQMVRGNKVCVIADPLIEKRNSDANAVHGLSHQL
jgi:hypothetical protein